MQSWLKEAQNQPPAPPLPWGSARCGQRRLRVPARATGSAPSQRTSDTPHRLRAGASTSAPGLPRAPRGSSLPRVYRCCAWTMSIVGAADGQTAACGPGYVTVLPTRLNRGLSNPRSTGDKRTPRSVGTVTLLLASFWKPPLIQFSLCRKNIK